MPPLIEVSAALVEDDAGRLLLVRKRGTACFMQCGGKAEAGESPGEALVRELAEEVGLAVAVADLEPLGTFSAAAANEAGHTVVAHVFRLPRLTTGGARALQPLAEIEELAWFDPVADRGAYAVAPLVDTVLLDLAGRA